MLLVPCVAWYVAGSRAVERESRSLLRAPTQQAEALAGRLSERLHGRLTSLLLAENQRPFYHYQNRYPDLTENCECASWVESPLAHGTVEPLIESYFEIDRTLAVTTPRMPADGASDGAIPPDDAVAVRALLQSSAPELVRFAWGSTWPPPPDFAVASAPRGSGAPTAAFVDYADGAAYVESFEWRTVTMAGEPRLVAVRNVRLTDARRVQGFLISTDAVNAFLEAPSQDVRFCTAVGIDDVTETADLGGTEWKIAVSVDDATVSANVRTARMQGEFRRIFWGGTGIASLAAALVLGLVRKSERLAISRSQFAAAAAHELRTPLAGLRVYAEMLADDLGDPTKGRAYARQVAAEAERLGRVVTNVLGFTRLERDSLEARLDSDDLGTTVRNAVEHARPALEALGIALEFEVAGEIPVVRHDADAITQMLQNLLDNAERYGRNAANRRVRVLLVRAGANVEVRVIDHGPGVDARDRSRLFRPFTRGRDADAPTGLGLGLPLVASFAKLHHGSVRHEPTPGGGATFVVGLPALR